MSAPQFDSEPAPNQAVSSPGQKVLSLRYLLHRERRKHSLIWYGTFGLLFAYLALLVLLGVIVYDVATGQLSDAFGSLAVSVFCLLLGTIPLAELPLRFRPTKTSRLLQQSLSPYGDPEKLIDEIDTELQDRSFVRDAGLQPDRFYRRTTGHLIFTKHWLLWFGWSEFRFLPTADVVWFYKRVEVQSRLWGVSDRVVPYLVCVTGSGEPFLFRLFAEDYVDEALQRLLRRRPEALCGFQGEWRALAETEPKALRQLVAERRAEWERLSAGRRADARDERIDDAFLNIRRVDSASSPAERRY